MSKKMASHQHSLKFGSKCANTTWKKRQKNVCKPKDDYNLGELPRYANVPADNCMTNQQRLHAPAEKVGQRKNVHVVPDALQRNVRAINRIFLQKCWLIFLKLIIFAWDGSQIN